MRRLSRRAASRSSRSLRRKPADTTVRDWPCIWYATRVPRLDIALESLHVDRAMRIILDEIRPPSRGGREIVLKYITPMEDPDFPMEV